LRQQGKLKRGTRDLSGGRRERKALERKFIKTKDRGKSKLKTPEAKKGKRPN